MMTLELNPVIVNRGPGMDIFDLEAERQGGAIKRQNVLRPAKKFFKRSPSAIPVSVVNKILN